MGNRQFDAEMTKWMNENPAPCRRCRERNATCHADCGKYRRWERSKNKARADLGICAEKQPPETDASRRKRLAAYNRMKGATR